MIEFAVLMLEEAILHDLTTVADHTGLQELFISRPKKIPFLVEVQPLSRGSHY